MSLVYLRTLLLGLLCTIGLFLGQTAHTAPSMRAAPPSAVSTAEVDTPANWQRRVGLYAEVVGPPDLDELAGRLVQHADESVPRLGAVLGLPAGRRIKIIVAPDEQTFDKMQPGPPPTWADGTAWPTHNLIFLHAPQARSGTAAPLEQVLEHELVHIMLGQAFAPKRAPHWLQEGTAQLLAREVRPDQLEQLASLDGSLIPLRDLTGAWPQDPVRAQRAYAQSALFVSHLRSEYGDKAFRDLVARMARGQSVDTAIQAATGVSLTSLDTQWRTRVAATPLWLQQIVSDTTLLGLGGLALVAGFLSVRRRQRATLDRWEREERIQNAIYDSLATAWQPHLPPRTETVWPHPTPDSPV